MRSGRINLGLGALDAAALLLAAWAASDLSWVPRIAAFSAIQWPASAWLFSVLLLWIVVSDRMQLGLFYPCRSELMARIILAVGIAGIGAAVLAALLGPPLRDFRATTFALVLFCLISATRLARRAMCVRSRMGSGRRHRVVIAGGGVLARELAAALQQDPAHRYEVVGFLAPEMEEVAGVSPNLTCEETLATIGVAEYLAARNVDQIYFTLPNSGDQDVLKLVAQCRDSGIAVSFVPHGYQLFITRSVLRNVGGIPLVAIDGRQTSQRLPRLKTVADATLASLLLLVTAPVTVATAMALARIRGSAFRRETRCGVGGRPFEMLRFNIDRGPYVASWFERWLEITKISELPQLWNVVRGEMSLVGPQAETAQRVQYYSEWQRQRLRFRPGVTGYAQLYGLRTSGSSAEWASCDTQYSFGWSPLLELIMMVQTLWFIARRIAEALVISIRNFGTSPLQGALEIASVNSSQPNAD